MLLRDEPAPMWLLVVLVCVTATGGPASMVGFDLARSFTPLRVVGRANGLVNVGGFSASLLTMALVGIVLDLREPAGVAAYGLDDFRVALSVQYLFWALGACRCCATGAGRSPTCTASTPARSSDAARGAVRAPRLRRPRGRLSTPSPAPAARRTASPCGRAARGAPRR